MALRRKERPLTLEEIKGKLLESTAESWLHSDPVCGFASTLDAGKFIPLQPKFETTIFVIFFLDPVDYSADLVMENLAVWIERYRKLGWTPLFAFQAKYLFLKNPRFFDSYRHLPYFQSLPIFIDPNGQWFHQVGATDSRVVFIRKDEVIFSQALTKNFSETIAEAESVLQNALRLHDPGLPLLEVNHSNSDHPIDCQKILAKELTLGGYWTPVENGIASDDPQAKFTLSFSGTRLRLAGITHPQARETAKAQIFLNDQPLPPNLRGQQVHAGDKGHSVLEINKHSGIYEILKSDANVKGQITAKFLNVLENPVILYELRIV